MGTSLSGLTPATTFDGLLKTSDNEPLDGTLKAISTGDGTDTILQLSNSALQVNGETIVEGATTGEFFKVRNASSPSQILKIEKQHETLNIFKVGTNDTGLQFYDGTRLRFFVNDFSNAKAHLGSDGNFGIGELTPTSRLHIKGSGATSATTSLLVQNSAGTELLKVQDDGIIDSQYLRINGSGFSPTISAEGNLGKALRLGNEGFFSSFNYLDLKTWDGSTYSPAMRITGNTNQLVGIGETTPTARLHVKAGTTQDTIARFQDPLNASTYIDIKNDSVLTDYVGLFWGNKAKIRSKQVGPIFMDCSAGVSFLDGNSAKSNINSQGAISIGATAVPASTMAYIKGSGATSATTALLVQNSAGTEHLKVTDDGTINVRQSLLVNHQSSSLRQLRLGWGSVFATDNASELQIGAVYSQAATAPKITLGGKTRASGADAIQVQTLNGMYIATTADSEDPSAKLHIKGSGNDATTTALLVQNSDGTDILVIGDDGFFKVRGGSGVSNLIRTNTSNNNVGIGLATPDSESRMHIKGKGATSATTALLVQNSAGTDLLKVQDDGNVITASIRATGNLRLGASGTDRYYVTNGQIHPLGNQDLGKDNSTSYHWNNVYSTGITHITDNTTSSTTLDSSAKLQVDSTTQGFLPPRMTETQRDAITTPAAGLMVYNTDTNTAECWNGSAWMPMF